MCGYDDTYVVLVPQNNLTLLFKGVVDMIYLFFKIMFRLLSSVTKWKSKMGQ